MSPGWLAGIAAFLATYEIARARLVRCGGRWPAWRRGSWWLAAGLLLAVWLLAAAGEGAGGGGRALWAESLQFGLLAFAVAPLAMLGAPAGLRQAGARDRTGRGAGAATPPSARPPSPRRTRHGRRPAATFGREAVDLVAFLAVTVAWRCPPLVDAVAATPALVGVEALTLVAGTWRLWACLAGTPARVLPEGHWRRVGLAVVAAWTTWVFAYAVGFSGRPFYPGYRGGPGAVAGQELAVGVLLATSAAALVPAVFANLVWWLRTDRLGGPVDGDPSRARLWWPGLGRGPLHRSFDDHGGRDARLDP